MYKVQTFNYVITEKSFVCFELHYTENQTLAYNFSCLLTVWKMLSSGALVWCLNIWSQISWPMLAVGYVRFPNVHCEVQYCFNLLGIQVPHSWSD